MNILKAYVTELRNQVEALSAELEGVHVQHERRKQELDAQIAAYGEVRDG